MINLRGLTGNEGDFGILAKIVGIERENLLLQDASNKAESGWNTFSEIVKSSCFNNRLYSTLIDLILS